MQHLHSAIASDDADEFRGAKQMKYVRFENKYIINEGSEFQTDGSATENARRALHTAYASSGSWNSQQRCVHETIADVL